MNSKPGVFRLLLLAVIGFPWSSWRLISLAWPSLTNPNPLLPVKLVLFIIGGRGLAQSG
jgi:hypothetical protein